jgi:hypothetical protein
MCNLAGTAFIFSCSAVYIPQTFPLLFVIIFLSYSTQTPRPGENGTQPGASIDVSPNTSLSGTQQEHRHQLVHRNAANAAIKNMTQNAHLKILCKIGSCKNKKQHATGCKYIHITVNDSKTSV